MKIQPKSTQSRSESDRRVLGHLGNAPRRANLAVLASKSAIVGAKLVILGVKFAVSGAELATLGVKLVVSGELQRASAFEIVLWSIFGGRFDDVSTTNPTNLTLDLCPVFQQVLRRIFEDRARNNASEVAASLASLDERETADYVRSTQVLLGFTGFERRRSSAIAGASDQQDVR